ncbi:hypothetical protein [Pseudoneobacillus sp. C159]
MKKQLLIAAFVILSMISITAIMKENEQFDTLKELKEENEHLLKKVSKLESDLRDHTSTIGSLENRNRKLEEEVDTLKSNVSYQDFLKAKNTVESYKLAKTFNDAMQYFARVNGTGITTLDLEGNCPCYFGDYNWKPHVVTELKELRVQKGKILLTYSTKNQQDYQFIMTEAMGWNNVERVKEEWRIEAIKPQ